MDAAAGVTYLLDTHAWIWSLVEPARLSEQARSVIEDGEQSLHLSAASIWEASILVRRGVLDLDGDLEAWLAYAMREYPVRELPITFRIALDSQRVELPQRDPVDRFLAATARMHGLVLITRDRELLAAPAVDTLAA